MSFDLIHDLFFNVDAEIESHLAQQKFNNEQYWKTLYHLLDTNANLSTIPLSKILACSLATNDKVNSQRLLGNHMYKLPEVLKTCEILDSRRKIVEVTKEIGKLTQQGAKNRKISKLKNKLDYNRKLNEGISFSLTRSKSNLIKKYWIKNISQENLEFYALSYENELKYWKQLADLLHVKPSDFKLDWFLNFIYTKEAPEDSIVTNCKKLTDETAFDIISKYKPSYNYVRRLELTLTDQIKELIASYTDLSTLIWWLEELRTLKNDKIIINKLVECDYNITIPYGVVVDKLFTIKNSSMDNIILYKHLSKMAEIKLSSYKVNLEQPIVVLGDASGSMEVAIKTSSIIMSILCAVCSSRMHLFNNVDTEIKNPPRTVSDVVLFNEHCKASGCTSPAAPLYTYYVNKIIVKTFIIVTDEEENTPVKVGFKNMRFAELFTLYRKDIYPAKLIFISLLRNATDNQMVQELQKTLTESVCSEVITQFIFDRQKPDLTKLDIVLARISTQKDNKYQSGTIYI